MSIEKFSTLRLKGRCFPNELTFTLFPNEGHRLAFVFGRNGSGKSTIANSVASLKNETLLDGMQDVSLIDFDGSELATDEQTLDSIHVFNDDFVESNVRVSNDGLDAIVMIGDAGELEDKITDAKRALAGIEKELEGRREKLDEYNDQSNPISPAYHSIQIRQALKLPGGWSEREKDIKSLRNSASVTDAICGSIASLETPEQPEPELRDGLQRDLERLHQLKSGEELPDAPTIDSVLKNALDQPIVDLLKKPIDKPIFTPREKRLLGIVETLGASKLEESRDYFQKESTTFCPYCFRDINSSEKGALVDTISLVLNEAVEAHKRELLDAELPNLIFDATPYVVLGETLTSKCQDSAASVQAVIEQYNALLGKKRENPYTSIEVEPLGLQSRLSEYANVISELQVGIGQWNADIGNREQLKSRLVNANKLLARHEVAVQLDTMRNASRKQEELTEKISELEASAEAKRAEIRGYENAKSNIEVALGEINGSLAFIFMDAKHLVLTGEKGVYKLYSHGQPVRPSDISSGERNAIALCYFFTKLSEGQPATDPYTNESMLIVDDPISSFDHENRIGILSFLRLKVKEVLLGNPRSRIVFFTHDGYSMSAFEKMKKDIKNAVEKASNGIGLKEPGMFILADGQLSGWKTSELGYTQMVCTVYEYANHPSDQLRPYIGNLTRKMLEAFATFEFGLRLSDFADNPTVLDKVKSSSARLFFSRLMFNLVLHAESHTSDPVQIEGIVETTPVYTNMTVDSIVKHSLCLMYCINPEHVITHLSEHEEAPIQLAAWQSDIEQLLGDNGRVSATGYGWHYVAVSDMEGRSECIHRAYLNPDEKWNGWACPYFEADEVKKMASWLKELDDGLIFNVETDAFTTEYDSERPDIFTGQDIDGHHLYPVGNGSWTWVLLDDLPEKEDG